MSAIHSVYPLQALSVSQLFMAAVTIGRRIGHFTLTKVIISALYSLELNRLKIRNPVRAVAERLVLGPAATAPPDLISGAELY